MGAIMKEEHDKTVRKLTKKLYIFNLVWILVLAFFVVFPYASKIKMDLVRESYSIAKREFDLVLMRQELLTMLRSKPITIGQALDIVDVVMNQTDVPIPMVLGVIGQESEFAVDAVSEKGARGLMQVMPATFKYYSINPLLNGKSQIHDPVLNMKAGISYLGENFRIYGDWKKALRIYVGGPENKDNKKLDSYAGGVLEKTKRFERVFGGR